MAHGRTQSKKTPFFIAPANRKLLAMLREKNDWSGTTTVNAALTAFASMPSEDQVIWTQRYRTSYPHRRLGRPPKSLMQDVVEPSEACERVAPH